MRFKFISAFAIFAVLPGISGAKLPAVDLSSGSISAASAFGDGAQTMRGDATPTKRVVSRNMKKTNVKYTAKKSDVDILSPNLPSSNLWAENAMNNDAPLRMPFADEVAVLHNDFELPDEDLSAKNIAKTTICNKFPSAIAEVILFGTISTIKSEILDSTSAIKEYLALRVAKEESF